jgi:hypothetical protein
VSKVCRRTLDSDGIPDRQGLRPQDFDWLQDLSNLSNDLRRVTGKWLSRSREDGAVLFESKSLIVSQVLKAILRKWYEEKNEVGEVKTRD